MLVCGFSKYWFSKLSKSPLHFGQCQGSGRSSALVCCIHTRGHDCQNRSTNVGKALKAAKILYTDGPFEVIPSNARGMRTSNYHSRSDRHHRDTLRSSRCYGLPPEVAKSMIFWRDLFPWPLFALLHSLLLLAHRRPLPLPRIPSGSPVALDLLPASLCQIDQASLLLWKTAKGEMLK